MRALIALFALCPVVSVSVGCGATSTSGTTSSSTTPRSSSDPGGERDHDASAAPEPFVPVDPAKALADPASTKTTYLVPGTVRLEPIGAPVDAPPGAPPIEVGIVDQQGSLVRLVIRNPNARFLVWSDRDRLFAIVKHDARVSDGIHSTGSFDTTESILRAGARVRRLAHKGTWTQVRYFGGIEIEGWIPDDALSDAMPALDQRVGGWYGGQRLMLMPGAIIRSEPKWASRELALMAKTPFVETVKPFDAEWIEVRYADHDAEVHGFVSPHQPPGRLHRPSPVDPPPTPITPTDKAPAYTCLYASEQGDEIGYLMTEQDVELSAGARLGWFKLAIDTPWGAMTFSAQGPTRRELMTCPPTATTPPTTP